MAPSTRSATGRQPCVDSTPANPTPALQPVLDYRPPAGGRESPTPQEAANESESEEEGIPIAGPSNVDATPEPTMTQVLAMMAQILATRTPTTASEGPVFRTPSMKAPDSFDRTNPSKLRGYIQSCNLIFHNDIRSFPNDRRKVIYAVGYLSGKCAKWIEPFLSKLGNEDPNFLLNNWEIFESQLFSLYGDRNETRNAELALDELTMKDNAYASTYITDFRALSGRIEGWDKRALMFHFQKGLPAGLLDQLTTHHSHINSLLELINITLEFDTCYHERQKEKRRETPGFHSKSAERRPEKEKFVLHTQPRSFVPSKKEPTTSTSKPRSELPLNALGKLREGEKDRREKAGLCVYCGGKHSLEECDKKKRVTSNVQSSSTHSSGKA